MTPLPVYKFRKINSNNLLFGALKYQITILDSIQYFKMRSWCLRYFGESIEYEFYKRCIPELNITPPWSWRTVDGASWKGQIYVKDDFELELFTNEYEKISKL